MQTISSQDQLNRIENELQHVKELLEILLGKIAQKEGKELDETPNEYFKQAIKEGREHRKQGKGSPLFTSDMELIKKDPKKYRHIDTMEQWFEEQGI
jgi:ElaB/YqjD/DUF883 family membrane-anchored ribosome-binding protein